MKHLYFVVFDTTRPNDSPEHAYYDSIAYGTDLAGFVTCIARKNGTEIGKIRLIFFETRKAWERAKYAHLARINSKYMDLPM